MLRKVSRNQLSREGVENRSIREREVEEQGLKEQDAQDRQKWTNGIIAANLKIWNRCNPIKRTCDGLMPRPVVKKLSFA